MAQRYTGRFSPKNAEKYKGDPTKIFWRSRWELVLMKFFDEHRGIVQWSSEELQIPYVSPIDGNPHRYFPDFWIQTRTKEPPFRREWLIEVKPKSQSVPPSMKLTKRQKPTARYIREAATYAVNEAKWKAAQQLCNARGWTFKVFTEDEIFRFTGTKV